MKAILYTIPSRHLLVLTDKDGVARVEHPSSETRAHQMAQDAGIAHIEFGRIEDALVPKKLAAARK
jgi:hypothetical protein